MSLPLAKMTDNQLPFLIILLTVIVFFGIIALRKRKHKPTFSDIDFSKIEFTYNLNKKILSIKHSDGIIQYLSIENINVDTLDYANICLDSIPVYIMLYNSLDYNCLVVCVTSNDFNSYKIIEVDVDYSE